MKWLEKIMRQETTDNHLNFVINFLYDYINQPVSIYLTLYLYLDVNRKDKLSMDYPAAVNLFFSETKS